LKSDKKTIQGGTANCAAKPAPAPAQPAPAKPALGAEAKITVPSDFSDEEESTRIADVSALAGAFSLAVGGATEAPPPDALNVSADEWFVGINGVPVGPIRLSELRSKAASGSVTRESLVWRDGFEDWRPLKTYPELVAIVDESVSSARASLTPFTPSVVAAGPVTAAGSVSDPFAFPVSPAAGAAPDAMGNRGAAVTGGALVTDDLEAAGLAPRRGASKGPWIAVVVAVLFGLTIGFVLFSKGQQQPAEIIKYVDRPVAAVGSSQESGKPTTIDESTVSGDSKNPGKHVGTTPKAATSAGGDTGLSTGLKGLSGGLSNLGPSRGPDSGGPSGASVGTGQLDAGQIQSTVARYTGSVKRACWQPALDTRDKDAPTTARVNVSISIAASGSVQNATTDGDPRGYRGLSQCISSRVRGWQFPPSGDSTTVKVPFVFAAQ